MYSARKPLRKAKYVCITRKNMKSHIMNKNKHLDFIQFRASLFNISEEELFQATYEDILEKSGRTNDLVMKFKNRHLNFNISNEINDCSVYLR